MILQMRLVFLCALTLRSCSATNPIGTDDDALWSYDDLIPRTGGDLLPLSEDCRQTYEYFPDLKCNAGHDLYRYTGYSTKVSDAVSCGLCDCNAYNGTIPEDSPDNEFFNMGPQCCPGWNGSQCDICADVSSCPALNFNGTLKEATQCTNAELVPINMEEAVMGKKYSCACGGGEDTQSVFACPLQGTFKNKDGSSNGVSSTRFDWIFTGLGTEDSPGTITLTQNAGVRSNSWDKVSEPGHYDYFYTVPWAGTLSDCVISEGKCLEVSGTDVGNQDCYNYDCAATNIHCPPEGVPVCSPTGTTECKMQSCDVVPTNELGFSVSCLKAANAAGQFVCYFQQPGTYAPMSMTCSVGNCLYNISNATGAIDYGVTSRYVPKGIAWQGATLGACISFVVLAAILIESLRRRIERNREVAFQKTQLSGKGNTSTSPASPTAAAGGGGFQLAAGLDIGLTSSENGHLDQPLLRGDHEKIIGINSGGINNSISNSREHFQGTSLMWHNISLWVPAPTTSSNVNKNETTDSDAEATAGAATTTPYRLITQRNNAQGSSPNPLLPDVMNEEEGGVPKKTASSSSGEKIILRGVSGSAQPRGLTALMGPSGAGKTSLLDCLAARKPMHRVSGIVGVNGAVCPPGRMQDVSGYVPQHDVLPGTMTVKEHLLFHAKLRCPPTMHDVDRRQRVDNLLRELGLHARANALIGGEFTRGLSGGEKRRVSVAEELVVEPGILFLDEPTTGLDSATAMALCQSLASIGKRGTTVLLSIHQPRADIFSLFDRVVVLCEGGRVVFEGSPNMVPAYLQRALTLNLCPNLPKVPAYLASLGQTLQQDQHKNGEDHDNNSSSRRSPNNEGNGSLVARRPSIDGNLSLALPRIGATAATPAFADEHMAAALKTTSTATQASSSSSSRLNPADLLLDVASSSVCQQLAEAVHNGTFMTGGADEAEGMGAGGGGYVIGTNNRSEPVPCLDITSSTFVPAPVEDHDLLEEAGNDDDEEEGASGHGSAFIGLQPYASSGNVGSGVYQKCMQWRAARRLSSSSSSSSFSYQGGFRRYRKPMPFPPRHRASMLLQIRALSSRLVLTAARHPMLLLLQYAGCLFLAVCVGFIFFDLEADLYGVQDRFGVLFFIPFCLILLGLSSLPVWRDEHILFTHEQANKQIYGYPAYFLSVLLFDVLLVRTVPPTFFALISYPLIGLNDGCDSCLLTFAAILVLINIVSSLIAMVVGAFRFSTAFSNLVGALLALLFALFAGFVVSKKAMADQGLPVYLLDPMSYAYEALMINQFGDQMTESGADFYYTINGSLCAPGLPTVDVAGNTLLTTFGFSSKQSDLQAGMFALWTGALWCALLAFFVLVGSSQAPLIQAWARRFFANWYNPCAPLTAAIRSAMSSMFKGRDEKLGDEVFDGSSSFTKETNQRGLLLDGSETGIKHSEENEDDDDEDDGDGIDDIVSEIDASEKAADLLSQTVASQLKSPELKVGERPPPMVLSFHNLRLSVPVVRGGKQQGCQGNGHFLCCGWDDDSNESDKENGAKTYAYGKKAGPAQVETRSCLWHGGSHEALGMHLVLSHSSPSPSSSSPSPSSSQALFLVHQIAPGSWAQKQGVKPGDALLSVGGSKLQSLDGLQPLLSSLPSPVTIDFLRRVPISSAPSSTTSKNSSKLKQPRPSPLTHAEVTERHRDLQPVLRGVSGSTVSSLTPALVSSSGSSTSGNVGSDGEHIRPLKPMMCGIMGPSGAGKTSLLDCLAGRKTIGVVTGEVRLNGYALAPLELRRLSGYVVQEDILPAMLTVRECLDFQAKLRVPSATKTNVHLGAEAGGADAESSQVEAVLKRMKLVKQQHTIVGNAYQRGLSGGEKRRVSVAIELLSEPAVLFLDEPTTGQDSTTAVMLCRSLKRIAKDGTTVVLSIHQPRAEIFELFTQIVFLAKDGRVAYCGPPRGVLPYLQTELAPSLSVARPPLGKGNGSTGKAATAVNPADALLDLMATVPPQDIVDAYSTSSIAQTQDKVLAALVAAFPPTGTGGDRDVELLAQGADDEATMLARLLTVRGKHQASWLVQFKHLAARALRNTLRNPFPFLLHGVTAVVAAVALGLVFHDIHRLDASTAGVQDRFGIMFFLLLYLSLLSLTSLPIWREDQHLFVAERGSGIYTTSPYVLSAILFDVLPYRLLPPLVFTAIAYPMVQLNNLPHKRLNFLVTLCCGNLALSGVCMLVGVLTRSNASANAAGSLLMLTSTLFCGFLLNVQHMPRAFLGLVWWSPGNFAYESLVYNEMNGLENLYLTSTIVDTELSVGPFTGHELAHCFGFTDQVNFNQFVLACMAAAYFGAVLVVMEVFIKEER